MRKKAPVLYQNTTPQAQRVWKAALYIRLSREDELQGESNSITSQREILREYLKQHPDIVEQDCYIDDGWTGTNFDRPAFKRMMEDIYAHRIDCVIVKDLSRFGRNYTHGGELITSEFVRLGVRFIAYNNFYDSISEMAASASSCITLGVTNVINESISATTSVNVRATLNVNRQQGKFIGSFACYGYRKDPEDHHKLLIDEEAAAVVRLIFDKYISGRSIIGIAKDLNDAGIPNPTTYKALKGFKYRHPNSEDGFWPDSSVRMILKNEMYIGNMVQGKTRILSYKDQISVNCPKEKWYRVEGTHEAIIDPETFERAQSLFNRNIRKSPQKRDVDLFAGLVRCSECGRIMNKKTNVHPYGTYSYYRCSTRRKMSTQNCSNHTIRIDRLETAVLVYLRSMISLAGDLDRVLKRINNSQSRRRESDNLARTMELHLNEREKCSRLLLDLYPDWKSGLITQEEYLELKKGLQDKIDALDARTAHLQASINELAEGVDSSNDFIAHFKKYGNIDRLTRPMLTELVESIMVHEGGRIEINLKFKDAFSLAVEYIDANKTTAIEVA